jgi:glucose 1-dehydrogenase
MKKGESDEKLPEVVMPEFEPVKRLKGQKALVTGGNSGIGNGIAIELGKAGAHVCINYIANEEQARKIAEEIKSHGTDARIFKADISKEDQVIEMFEYVKKKFGTIDILVNNAGIQKDAALEEMTLKDWNKVMSVNLTGQFLCAREAVKEFKRRGVVREVSCSAGKIICISSVHEVIPWAGHVNYAASKGGVMLMMKSIAQEVAPHRIRVNSISPGAVRTSINKDAWDTEEAYDSLMERVPYKRIGEVEDIGRTAVWLASDDADYVNGASIYVDGGMTLYPGFQAGS